MNFSRSVLVILSVIAGLAASSCVTSGKKNQFSVKKRDNRGWGEMYGGGKKSKAEDLPPIPVPASGPEKPLEAPKAPRGPEVPAYEPSPYDDPDLPAGQ